MRMISWTVAIVVGVITFACQNVQGTRATSEAHDLVRDAAAVARLVKVDPKLQPSLQQAKGLFIVPKYGKGAAILGGSGGEGVVLARAGSGWSAPVFFDVGKISIGAQAGGQAGHLAMLLMTDKALDAFKAGTTFSLNATSGFTLVDYSANAQASIGAGQAPTANAPDIIVWSDVKGAFAGVAIGATAILPDQGQNRAYYNQTVSAQDVFNGKVTGPPDRPIRSVLAG